MKTERENYTKLMNVIIEEYLNTPETQRSLTQLQRKYGIRRQTIAEHLRKRGIEIINQQNRCRVDENVFDVIDTEEKAYWLGFMYADGNISSKGHRLEVNLSDRDVEHIIKFQKFLKLENNIRIDAQGTSDRFKCRLSVRNKHLWEMLNEKGCVPCKSLILKFPNETVFSSKNLIYDFIRGYCDGDGSLGMYPIKNTIYCNLGFIGTEEFLIKLREFLGIPGTIRNKSCTNWANKAFELKYSGVGARKVARLLYENSSVYLDRKYKIYENFCRFEEESSLRPKKSSKISRRWDANTEVSSEITKGSETPQRIESE